MRAVAASCAPFAFVMGARGVGVLLQMVALHLQVVPLHKVWHHLRSLQRMHQRPQLLADRPGVQP